MVFFRPVKTKKRSKRYEKVSHRCRILLLKRVLCDKSQIKDSAEQLDINYSTAKTIMRKYKRCGNQMNLQVLSGISDWYEHYETPKQRCEYRIIDQKEGGDNTKLEEVNNSMHTDLDRCKIEEQGDLMFKKSREIGNIQILQQVLFKK